MNAIRRQSRLLSLDVLRGLVMVLMALDHTRDFFTNAHFDPTNLDKTSVTLFLTRWVTHFCAPVFVFLAGIGVFLFAAKQQQKVSLTGYLLGRGVLLILIQISVEKLAWNFRPDFLQIEGGVLWAIGWSMIALAGLIKFPLTWVGGFGLVMILGHNLFDGVNTESLGALGSWWAILHTGTTVTIGDSLVIKPYYPLIPWVGVMAASYAFGSVLLLSPEVKQKCLMTLGGTMIIAFILLRYFNFYGDPKPWTIQNDWGFTILSFINCEKYPPSLLYLLMTLGPAFWVLIRLEKCNAKICRYLIVLGRVPLFFYILHIYVIHLLAVIVNGLTEIPIEFALDPWSTELPQSYGFGLPVVYLIWGFVLLTLYPLCQLYADFKTRHRHWSWLKYF